MDPATNPATPATPVAPVDYDALARTLDALLAGEADQIANAANTAALLYHTLPAVSWVGFYFTRPAPAPGQARDDGAGGGTVPGAAVDGASAQLVLGPFQGRTACVRIAWGRGVCGTAAASRQTQRVPDVHAFPGHIACDPDARSEVVVPLITADGDVLGVLDVDSTLADRFTPADAAGLERLAAVFLAHCAPPGQDPGAVASGQPPR